MKIGIMGYFPPPIGGISMHVKRLGELLQLHNIDYKIYSIGDKDYDSEKVERYTNRRKWATKYMFSPKEDIIHCHIMGWSEKAFYLLLGKLSRKKVIYTFHSYRDTSDTLSPFYKMCFKFVRKFGDGFIAVGKSDYGVFKKEGFDLKKVHYIPGFIAPKEEVVEIPAYINEFLDQGDFTICGNASNNNFYNNEDLYGIDLCIDLVKSLKEQGKIVRFVFFLPYITQQDYYETLLAKIKEYDIEEAFKFVNDSIDFYHIIKKCDVFLRPTNTDGDAISIREALYYGTPVIASDVVSRPSECLLFESRSSEDLSRVALKVMNNYSEFENIKVDDFGTDVIRFYEKVSKSQLIHKEKS